MAKKERAQRPGAHSPGCRNVKSAGVKPIRLVLLQGSESSGCGSHTLDGWLSLRPPSASAAWESRSQMNRERKLNAFRGLSVTGARERWGIGVSGRRAAST